MSETSVWDDQRVDKRLAPSESPGLRLAWKERQF